MELFMRSRRELELLKVGALLSIDETIKRIADALDKAEPPPLTIDNPRAPGIEPAGREAYVKFDA